MKYSIATFMGILIVISINAGTRSKITGVTVYQNGAKVTRIANVNLKAGNNQILLSGISEHFQQNSVQASCADKAMIVSVKTQYNYLFPAETNKRIIELQDSADFLNNEITWLNEERNGYNKQLEVLEKNSAIVTGEGKLTAIELQELVEYYGNKQQEIRKNLHELHIYLKDISKVYNRVQAQLREIQGQKKQKTGEVVVEVLANAATTIQLEINYIVNRAGWTPLYDLRSNEGEDNINMVYKANVYQNTGNNWNDVKLTVSTGNPFQSNDRPILRPWYIDFMPEYKAVRSAPMMKMATSNMAIADDDIEVDFEVFEEEELAAPEYMVVESSNQLNASYEISHTNSILSNNKKQLVLLKEYKVGAQFKYHTVPKLNQSVFLIAKIGGYGKYNLLSGQANIFLDGTYIGQTHVNTANATDSILVSFGRSNNLTVERTLINDLESRKFMGSNTIETRGYKIKVINNNKTDAQLEILDQIPVTRHEDIKVEILDQGGAAYNQITGRMFWDINLPPGKMDQVSFKYQVKYPKDREVTGL